MIARDQSSSQSEKQIEVQTETRDVTIVDFDTAILPDGTRYLLLPCGEKVEINGESIMRVKVPCDDVGVDGNIELVALDDDLVPLGPVYVDANNGLNTERGIPPWAIILIAIGAVLIGVGGSFTFIRFVSNRR